MSAAQVFTTGGLAGLRDAFANYYSINWLSDGTIIFHDGSKIKA